MIRLCLSAAKGGKEITPPPIFRWWCLLASCHTSREALTSPCLCFWNSWYAEAAGFISLMEPAAPAPTARCYDIYLGCVCIDRRAERRRHMRGDKAIDGAGSKRTKNCSAAELCFARQKASLERSTSQQQTRCGWQAATGVYQKNNAVPLD